MSDTPIFDKLVKQYTLSDPKPPVTDALVSRAWLTPEDAWHLAAYWRGLVFLINIQDGVPHG